MSENKSSEARAVRPVVRRLQGCGEAGEVLPRWLLEQAVNPPPFLLLPHLLSSLQGYFGACECGELFLV